MKKCVLVFVSVVCASMLLTGCAETEEIKTEIDMVQKEEPVQVQVEPMEEAPVLDYEVPKMVPGAIVTQTGYRVGKEKRAVFQSKILPEYFQIFDAADNKAVYKGKIDSPVYNEETGLYTGYGDFTTLETSGEYYIKCERIGISYTFTVTEDYYESSMEEAVKKLVTLSEEELYLNLDRPSDEVLIEKCRTISALVFACELFPKMQADGLNGDKNDIPDVLDYAATQAAFLASWQDDEDGSLGEATGWYSAALAKLSYSYQKYNSTDATRFLQAADRAWKYIEKNSEKIPDEERFFAAAELYRATGKNSYHKVVKSLGKALEPDIQNETLTYGAITYFSTKHSVNRDICKKYMNDLMERAEEIAQQSADNAFFVEMQLTGDNTQEFFQNLTVMVLVDYVITNEEYGSLIEDHQHYLMGRNEMGESYFDFENCESIAQDALSDNSVWLAKYILMLSEILSRE